MDLLQTASHIEYYSMVSRVKIRKEELIKSKRSFVRVYGEEMELKRVA